jgi:hypothetical protein
MRFASMVPLLSLCATAFAAAPLACADASGDVGGTGSSATGSTTVGSGGSSSGSGGGTSGSGGGSGSGGAGGGGVGDVSCIAASNAGAAPDLTGTASWSDGADQATVTIGDPAACHRNYQLTTTAPLRDNEPANPRSVPEIDGQPTLRSGHAMFDALYALAHEEVREASVDAIVDGAFNGGNPVSCPFGGCFETGRLWRYVWTRDTAYAVLLGLGAVDPKRAMNSLAFKLSERRGGGDLQIVQDTGTGGSYPVSTDRAVWALGAMEVLKYLDGTEREDFRDLAYEAMHNTADHDRLVVFDASDGLYRGEQSFLDWREQSYPGWVADDPVHIGTSKTLSTNVGHLELLRASATLATEKGLTLEAMRYQGWADALATAIASRFYLSELGGFSSYITTALDPAPALRLDLLGSALAVSAGVGDPTQRATAVASYPTMPKGPPVLWPQQQLTPIYHNRGIWPFVTALWLRAAKSVQNAKAVTEGARSLIRGAALNLSNMENFEAASGAAWLDDGAYSGPVVNSQRQLWSVAGYLSLVQDVVFGLEATQAGIRFQPFVPRELRNSLFAAADHIVLRDFRYKGKRITVELDLGAVDSDDSGALVASSVELNGQTFGTGFASPADLGAENLFRITLAPSGSASDNITVVDNTDIADYQNVFGPKTPTVSAVALDSDRLGLTIDIGAEAAADVAINVYRDGARIASDLPGTTGYWVDSGSAAHATTSYCYTVESYYLSSGNASQRAQPVCYWGAGNSRITTVDASSFVAVGGTLVNQYGRDHYQGWGDAGHTLTIDVTATHDGLHYLQLLAGNGSGAISTGVTCAVKHVAVFDGGTLVGAGHIMMPQLGDWSLWRGSSLLPITLQSGKSYSVVIGEDNESVNMSEREHFAIYSGTGGSSGRFNRVNIAELKLLSVAP